MKEIARKREPMALVVTGVGACVWVCVFDLALQCDLEERSKIKRPRRRLWVQVQ